MLGLQIAGFPNLFTITGPGSPSVLMNMPVAIEHHVDWIAECIEYMREHGWHAHRGHRGSAGRVGRARRRGRADSSLFAQANSWYVGANIPGKPRVVMPYAGGQPRYRERCDAVRELGVRRLRVRRDRTRNRWWGRAESRTCCLLALIAWQARSLLSDTAGRSRRLLRWRRRVCLRRFSWLPACAGLARSDAERAVVTPSATRPVYVVLVGTGSSVSRRTVAKTDATRATDAFALSVPRSSFRARTRQVSRRQTSRVAQRLWPAVLK